MVFTDLAGVGMLGNLEGAHAFVRAWSTIIKLPPKRTNKYHPNPHCYCCR